MPEDYPAPGTECPYCSYKFDLIGKLIEFGSPRPPYPGDITLCIQCANILVLDITLAPRRPTVSEWSEVLGNPQQFFELKRIQRLIFAAKHLHGAHIARMN